MALNDQLINETSEFDLEGPTKPVRVLRIPSILPLRRRVDIASKALRDWQPDWVSIVIIVYNYNPKGIMIRELLLLPGLLADYPLHVQLHELWIGGSKHTWSFKDFLVGAVQRAILLMLLRRLSPAVLHTHIPYYQKLLRQGGITAGLFPLSIGNIPVSDRTAQHWLFPVIHQNGGPDLSVHRADWWLIGMFGGVAGDWPDADATRTLTFIAEIAARARRQVIIASIGRAGDHGQGRIERWRDQFPQIKFIVLGPKPENEVSQFFNSIDFGLTSYPVVVLGKSGSAAAMLEHGLPIIVSWGDIEPDVPPILGRLADLVWKDDDRLESRMLNPPPRIRNYDGPKNVVDHLLAELEQVPLDARLIHSGH